MGVGMAMPSFTAVALSVVEPSRTSTAIGISSMFAQIGNALGAAAFVAVVGSPAAFIAVATFHRGWAFTAAMAVIAAVMLLAAGRQPRFS